LKCFNRTSLTARVRPEKSLPVDPQVHLVLAEKTRPLLEEKGQNQNQDHDRHARITAKEVTHDIVKRQTQHSHPSASTQRIFKRTSLLSELHN
jgi:hypothetical protein